MVKSVVEFQGKHTVKVIEAGLFESVMWPYLGKIKAPIGKVQAKNAKVGERTNSDTNKPTI